MPGVNVYNIVAPYRLPATGGRTAVNPAIPVECIVLLAITRPAQGKDATTVALNIKDLHNKKNTIQ